MKSDRESHLLALSRLPPPSHPAYACALGLLIAIALILTLRGGTEWDGDDALYIMNARNIVLGLPYGNTPYIFNPANPINPTSYPPGFPLLLAPIYWLFGVSFAKMKVLCIVCFAAFVSIFARIAVRYVSPGLALAAAAVVGMHPYYWDFKDTLYSEFPFMFTCYAALLLIDKVQRANDRHLVDIAAAIIALAAAYLIRAIGIVVFPAALLSALMISRRAIALTSALLGCAVLIILIIQRIFPADLGTYVGYFRDFSLHGVHMALLRYGRVRSTIIGTAVVNRVPVVATCLELALGLMVLVGFLAQVLRHRISVFEMFFIGYSCFLIIYPVTLEPDRYAMPIWPFLFLYAASGLAVLMRFVAPVGRRIASGAIAAVIVGCYAAQYSAFASVPLIYPIEAPPSLALFAAIRGQVPTDAVVLTRKPTTIALLTGRRATVWGLNDDDSQLWDYITRQRVSYIVQERYRVFEANRDPNAVIDGFVERNEPKLQLVFRNAWYNLYRVASTS